MLPCGDSAGLISGSMSSATAAGATDASLTSTGGAESFRARREGVRRARTRRGRTVPWRYTRLVVDNVFIFCFPAQFNYGFRTQAGTASFSSLDKIAFLPVTPTVLSRTSPPAKYSKV